MRKQILTVSLVIALLLSATIPVSAASSQPSPWAAASIARANELNLVSDEMNQNFQSPTTRAGFCRLISRFLIIWYDAPIDYQIEKRGLTPSDFNDTNEYMIRAAAALGITSGTGNGNFSPDGQLTREQAAGMHRNALIAIGVDTANPVSVPWADKDKISTWAGEAADVMYAAKIMSGTSTNPLTFSPKLPYTHEQAVITVLNLWDYAISQNISRSLPEGDIEYGKQPNTVQYMTDILPAYQKTDKNYFREYSAIKSGSVDSFSIAGEKYLDGFTLQGRGSITQPFFDSALWNLNGQYRNLTATLGHVDETPRMSMYSAGSGVIRIFFDGVLNQEIEVSGDMIPQSINLDLNGVKQLKISWDITTLSDEFGFGNPILW